MIGFRRCGHAAPEFLHLSKIQLRGDPETELQCTGPRQLRVKRAGNGNHRLEPQVLQRKIDQVEIDAFAEQPGGADDRIFAGSRKDLRIGTTLKARTLKKQVQGFFAVPLVFADQLQVTLQRLNDRKR